MEASAHRESSDSGSESDGSGGGRGGLEAEERERKRRKKEKRKHKKAKKKAKKKARKKARKKKHESEKGGGPAETDRGSYSAAVPDRSQWAAAAAPSAAQLVGVSDKELLRQRTQRKRRFEGDGERSHMAAEGRGPTRAAPRVAHSGGKITTNKESAIHAYVVRTLKEGKELSAELATAARRAGVQIDRLKEVYGAT